MKNRQSSPKRHAELTLSARTGMMEHVVNEQRDVAQFGSAPALGAGCRRFKSCHPNESSVVLQHAELDKLETIDDDDYIT